MADQNIDEIPASSGLTANSKIIVADDGSYELERASVAQLEAYLDSAYDPAGTAASAVSAHEGAADPHPGYALESALGSAAAANTTDFAPAAHVGAGGTAHANAIAAGAAGFMSGADKSKLDGIATGAQVNPTNTDSLTEGGTNLYHTAARVLGQVLTGLSTAAGTVVTASHTILQAIGFLQKQVSDNATAITGKQATLVSGTNIKTINSNSLLGSGDLAVSATPGGSTTQVQFNDGGAFGGDAGLTFDKTTKTLKATNGVDWIKFRGTNSYTSSIESAYTLSLSPAVGDVQFDKANTLNTGSSIATIGRDWLCFAAVHVAPSVGIKFRNNWGYDQAVPSLDFIGAGQYSANTTYLVGGAINITGGAGASGSAGAANGGAVNLSGGAGYGTGKKGSVNASRLNAAGFATAIAAKTANYTATADDGSIEVDATSGAVTITLPAVSGAAGRIYVIKKTDASGNAVTVDPNASETIDGAATASLASQYSTITIQANAAGTAWHKVSGV